jgi:hypothetical protein
MKIFLGPLFIAMILSTGCKKDPLTYFKPGENIFKIPAGENDAEKLIVSVAGAHRLLRFEAILYKDTAPTSIAELSSYNQVNKLFGFNDCKGLQGNHENSARIGWYFHEATDPNTPNTINLGDGKLYVMDVLPYTYINGTRTYDTLQPLASIRLDVAYQYEIRIEGSTYVMTIREKNGNLINSITTPRGCSNPGSFTFINYPYFGGASKAPHDMRIGITLL